MSFFNKFIPSAMIALSITSCNTPEKQNEDFNYNVDRFADIEVLRYKVPEFDSLSNRSSYHR